MFFTHKLARNTGNLARSLGRRIDGRLVRSILPIWTSGLLVALLAVLALPDSTTAAPSESGFPYEAAVEADEEYVRSGPGAKYYPTLKLKRGEKVVVHRHDPGGWAMIAPPPGSFNWVPAEYVTKIGPNTGSLTANSVLVYVGSTIANTLEVYQQTLSTGDEVEILSEQTVNTEKGQVAFYKITPPGKEYRWIAGKSLIPVDGVSRPGKPQPLPKPSRPMTNDPFSGQAPPAGEWTEESGPIAGGALPTNDGLELPLAPAVPGNTPAGTPGQLVSQDGALSTRDQLRQVDNEFRDMLRLPPLSWNLATLDEAYRQIDQAAAQPGISRQIAMRQDALKRYSKIKAEYDDFERLTAQTRQKDAALIAAAQGGTLGAPTTATGIAPIAAGPQPTGTSPAGMQAGTGGTPAAPVARKFDGAGVVQRSAATNAGAPPFVLTTPAGKVLAYLQPQPGVELDRYVGFPMGIMGARSFDQNLQADLIQVREVTPVQLRSGK